MLAKRATGTIRAYPKKVAWAGFLANVFEFADLVSGTKATSMRATFLIDEVLPFLAYVPAVFLVALSVLCEEVALGL